jgi:hypothetical protein
MKKLFVLLYMFCPTLFAGAQQKYQLENPIRANDVPKFIADVLAAVVQIGIPICILAIIYVGFRYVKAQGKPEELKEVHAAFLYTVVGIAIFIGATVIAGIIQGTICDIGFTNLCSKDDGFRFYNVK